MRRATCAAALSLLLVALPARGEIYRWVDDAGRVHLDDDLSNVPESKREGASIFKAKTVPALEVSGPTQGAFAGSLARELGLQASTLQDPISVLQVVGIYPAIGWNPSAALSSAVVGEVVMAARAAARAGRLRQPEAGAEAAALRVASTLGIAGPPPSALPEPESPPQAAPIVIAPNIVVEAPPPVVVVQPATTRHRGLSPDLALAWGVPFAPLPVPPVTGPVPARITPLFNPAGQLRGPLVTPLESRPFTRPAGF